MVDWSKLKATRRDPAAASPEDDPTPVSEPITKAKKAKHAITATSEQTQRAASDQRMVHEWILAQCSIDADFRKTYEDFIGPVPQISYGVSVYKMREP